MQNLHVLSAETSILNNILCEIRDKHIQKDRRRFRDNMRKIGNVLAWEISKKLLKKKTEVHTPLGVKKTEIVEEMPVLVTILRAGLALHEGLLEYFPDADNAFISAYRKHHKDGSFEIKLEYMASPVLENRTVILSDPMLATGNSIVVAYKALLGRGKPREIHVAGVIASSEGIRYIRSHLPENTHIWVGDVDQELTAQAYIVPGLGDAGDLAFGSKEEWE